MTVFLTGGTGFIGRKVIDFLLERNETVHLLVRKTSNIEKLDQERINLFTGCITDKKSIIRGMKGCDRVIHSAAYAQNWAKNYLTYYKFNIDGMKNVAEAALSQGIHKFVYVSTAVTFGPSLDGIVNEETPRKVECCYTDYEHSKVEAEKEMEKLEKQGLPVITVNPTRVYGPGFLREANSVTRMIRLFLKGKFPFILSKGNEIGNYAFIDDVASGIINALYREKAGGKYILGGENCSLNEFFAVLSEISGRNAPGIKVPPFAAYFFSRISELLARYFSMYPLITSGWVDTFLQNWAFSSEKAVKELGYEITPLKEGLNITCDWLRQKNLV